MPYKDPEAQRKYQRGWRAQRRQEWFAANGPCVDCGTWDDLEIDHVDRSTKVSHKVWTWAQERRDVELAKCVVRCDPCHRIKTLLEYPTAHKLDPDKVREIRKRRAAGEMTKPLAEEFGLSTRTVRMVLARTLWAWVE